MFVDVIESVKFWGEDDDEEDEEDYSDIDPDNLPEGYYFDKDGEL